jgi:hypothetical protein
MVVENTEYERTTWPRRVRSAVLLAVFVGVLGAAAAGILGVLIVAGTSFIDHALG